MNPPSTTLKYLSHRDELGPWLTAAGLTGKGVEVGVLYGAYTSKLLSTWPGHVCAVDPWQNQDPAIYFDGQNTLDMNHVWAQVQAALGQHRRCTLMRMMSLEAAKRFEDCSLCAIYLDGNHALEAIRPDINAWFPKVKIGGIFGGHDFFSRYDKDTNSDASTAVMDFAERIGIRPHVTWDTSWWFVKTAEADAAFHASVPQAPRVAPVDNSTTELVAVLAVSHTDFHLAVKWLKWLVWLERDNALPDCSEVVVYGSKALQPELWSQLKSAATGLAAAFRATPEVYERGYGPSANYIFRTALEMVSREHPGRGMLWCEADTVPMRPTWLAEVQAEYQSCGKPFMGDFVIHPKSVAGIDHLTGVAVYSPQWRKYAPSLAMLPAPRPEQGWDSSCSHETLPQAARSKTIQQIWRYGTKDAQPGSILPSTALFHQCKTGAVIDSLCVAAGFDLIPLGPQLSRVSSVAEVMAQDQGPQVEFLIVTFRRDIDFLKYCLRSIEKYATGFSGITLVVPESEKKYFAWVGDRAKLRYIAEPDNKGMLAHEIAVCRADEHCPKADFVVHMDADCMLWRATTPSAFIPGGKCLMVYERYAAITNPNRHIWKRVVTKCAGFEPQFETMVRHPQVYPRALYPRVRKIVEDATGREFGEYVYSCENNFPQGFAEFPLLGAVGLRDMPDLFAAMEYDHADDAARVGREPGSFQYAYRPARDHVVELHSHSGLARYKADMDKFLLGQLPEWHIK